MTATKDDGTVEVVGPLVTAGLIKAIAPAAKLADCEIWAPSCDAAARHYEINTPVRVCWWLGQGLYECDQLRQLREPVSSETEKYDGGSVYRGAGLGHLTHLRNFLRFAPGLEPWQVSLPEHSPAVWGEFWTQMDGNGLVDTGRFEATSSAIHRGDPNKPCLPSTHHEIRAAFAERGLRYLSGAVTRNR